MERHVFFEHQKFEHELINRRIKWLLTSQTILFAAFALGAGKINSCILDITNFLRLVAVSGLVSSFLILLGIIASALAKFLNWRDYVIEEIKRLKISKTEIKKNRRLQWTVRTKLTILGLIPDLFFPILFMVIWILIIKNIH